MTPTFPESSETVQATLTRVLELQGLSADAQLLKMAAVTVDHTDHDNWNGGIDYYCLRLRIPLEVFVQLGAEIEVHEKRVCAVAATVWRDLDADVINTVQIAPDRQAVVSGRVEVTSLSIPPFWREQGFRLFLSHCSAWKVDVAALKEALSVFGVSAFVAHEDIEPTLLWQAEIEKGLRTCEALAAVITDEFVASQWCDQEVGFALGRGVPVIAVQFTKPPHGFIAKTQALKLSRGAVLASLAQPIVNLLLKSPQTASSVTSALVTALATAGSFAQAKAVAAALESVPSLTAAHAVTLERALRTNGQVRDAFGVPDRIARILRSFGDDRAVS